MTNEFFSLVLCYLSQNKGLDLAQEILLDLQVCISIYILTYNKMINFEEEAENLNRPNSLVVHMFIV